MERMVIRAEYKSTNVYNDGYILINGDKTEGIFTLDYAEIKNSGDIMTLTLFEKSHYKKNGQIIERTTRKIYESDKIDQILKNQNKPLVFHNKYETLYLLLFELERDKMKIEKLFNQLETMRPRKKY